MIAHHNKKTIVAGYRSAGFLAYLTSQMQGTGVTHIPFDTEVYDYGDNYDPVTGIYTVPYNGLYLIHARVYGWDNWADHYIRVDNDWVTFTRGADPSGYQFQATSTSIVLHLVAGQEVGVDPYFDGTIDGNAGYMRTSFGITLLYRD